ncbi:hypothetical protein Tco_1007045 [Tanacetum coccineum]|uniref:Uncharacterized protein n=1 Tax=Tanacetum coccineum TaxID=301880 RepID=A0ABQ5FJL4_9ASTR
MKDKDQVSSSKKGKYPSKSSKSNKPIDAEDVVREVDMDVAESVENDVVDADNPTQADDNVPKCDNSKWFKEDAVVRPETPDPEWHKEPSNAPEQPWADIRTTSSLSTTLSSVALALTGQLDWVNPEGNRIPHDLSDPLPLQGPQGYLKILIDFFFNKDLEYLTGENTERRYATSLTKPKAARYDLEGIEQMITP